MLTSTNETATYPSHAARLKLSQLMQLKILQDYKEMVINISFNSKPKEKVDPMQPFWNYGMLHIWIDSHY